MKDFIAQFAIVCYYHLSTIHIIFLFPSTTVELLIDKEDEQINVNFGFPEHLHNSHTFIL